MAIDQYEAAYTGLVGIMVLATFPLFFVACFMVPQRGDTARRGFIWLKIAFFTMFLSVLLITVDMIIIVVLESPRTDLTLDAIYAFEQVSNQLGILGSFFQQVSLVFLLFTLVDVSLGILYCWNVMRGPRSILQWVTYGFGFIEVVLAIAIMAEFSVYGNALYTWLRNDDDRRHSPDTSQLPKTHQIMTAYDILMFIAALAMFGFAIYVLVLASKRPNLDHRQAAVLVLVASVLFAVANLWSVIGDAVWLLKARVRPEYTYIVEAILSFWTQFVSLVLLFAIGVKKYAGLWSIPTNFAPPVQYYGYNANSGYNGYNGQPMVQQQPYPQQYPQPYPQPYGAPQQYAPQPQAGSSEAAANELHSQTIKPY